MTAKNWKSDHVAGLRTDRTLMPSTTDLIPCAPIINRPERPIDPAARRAEPDTLLRALSKARRVDDRRLRVGRGGGQ